MIVFFSLSCNMTEFAKHENTEKDDHKVKIVVTVLSLILVVFGVLLVAHYIRRFMTRPSTSGKS